MNWFYKSLIFTIGFYLVFYIFKGDEPKKIDEEKNRENLQEYQKMVKQYNGHYDADISSDTPKTEDEQMKTLKDYQKMVKDN